MVNNLRVLFFVLTAFISCTLFSFCNTQDDNAAPYYIKACELIKYPSYGYKDNPIDDIIKNGYRSKNSQIEDLLKNNEPAFKELEKGVTKPKCDFTPFAKSFRGGIPNYMELRNLARLSTVKGLYYVSLGKYDKASDSYLNVITLAKHLPQQDKLLLKKMFDVSLVAMVTPSIKALLQEEAVSKETLTKIDKQLHDYELHTVTLVEIFQAYKGEIMNGSGRYEIYGIKAQLNDSLKKSTQRMSASERKFLYDTTLTEAEALINRYMGYYIKAAQTNNPSDWDFAEKEHRLLSESATLTPTSSLSYIIKSWLNSIIYKKAALKETAKMLAKMFVSIDMSTLARVREQYYQVMNGIKEVRGLIAKRLH